MINLIQQALNNIFEKITGDHGTFNLQEYKIIKAKKSSQSIASILNINMVMLNEFEIAVSDFYKFNGDSQKSRISSFRLALWLETICKNLKIPFNIESVISNEELAIKQVRALELIIRDIVNENLGGKDNVFLKLQDLFKQEIVEKWLKNGDETGVLSGTTFSELSNIFLNKNIFVGLKEIFDDKEINLSGDSRDSLRKILEDIRLIRNSIAHNKKVTKIQIEALNEFYKTIANLIKESKVNNINPDSYLDLDKVKMADYLYKLQEDNNQIIGNLEGISASIKEGFSSLDSKTAEIHKVIQTSWLSKKSVILISTIVVLLIVGLASIRYYQTRPIDGKIKLEWITNRASYEYTSLKQVKLISKNGISNYFITSDGIISFDNLDYDNLDSPIILKFENPNIYQIDTPLLIRDLLIPIKIHLKNLDKVEFSIRDQQSGAPIKDANVSFGQYQGLTNNLGKIIFHLPKEKQSKYIDINVFKNGYKNYRLNEILVNSLIPVEIMLEKN